MSMSCWVAAVPWSPTPIATVRSRQAQRWGGGPVPPPPLRFSREGGANPPPPRPPRGGGGAWWGRLSICLRKGGRHPMPCRASHGVRYEGGGGPWAWAWRALVECPLHRALPGGLPRAAGGAAGARHVDQPAGSGHAVADLRVRRPEEFRGPLGRRDFHGFSAQHLLFRADVNAGVRGAGPGAGVGAEPAGPHRRGVARHLLWLVGAVGDDRHAGVETGADAAPRAAGEPGERRRPARVLAADERSLGLADDCRRHGVVDQRFADDAVSGRAATGAGRGL